VFTELHHASAMEVNARGLMPVNHDDDRDFVTSVMGSQNTVKCVEESLIISTRKRSRTKYTIATPQNTEIMGAISTMNDQMTMYCSVLETRIEDIEKNFEENLLKKFDITIDNKIDKEINDVKTHLAKMEKACTEATKAVKLAMPTSCSPGVKQVIVLETTTSQFET
jgi:hypothetical protein